ncbi:hypothetical protein RhiirA4_486745 [Rhizophagus irregularis]|uniref:Uncharacterized protein n=1 Tax=Rhizophagus irregularis TaxID=588596 RepID=A0A2I1HRR2_9GLOM|nr:hypothetical protein RhiirA4_486745 [Rhizophagus irregularis]
MNFEIASKKRFFWISFVCGISQLFLGIWMWISNNTTNEFSESLKSGKDRLESMDFQTSKNARGAEERSLLLERDFGRSRGYEMLQRSLISEWQFGGLLRMKEERSKLST